MDNRYEWIHARERLREALTELGHPGEFADVMAKQLGSPKAIDRMTAYLHHVRPRNIEEVIDEMLAICSEIDAWKQRKASQQANMKYTEYLNSDRDA